jgi:hypothetical protein
MTADRTEFRPRPARSAEPVVVTIVGPGFPVAEFAAHLPPRWRVRHLRAVAGTVCPDAIVVAQATPRFIRRLRAGYPTAEIVAVVGARAAIAEVVQLLESGAGACVRAGKPELLASHLRERIRPVEPAPVPA